MSDIASTTCGKVQGKKVSQEVLRFSHIPYARAPLGEFRFMPPAAMKPWEGVRDGREHGPSSIQALDEVEANSLRAQSEDCLWLSIWTQGLDAGKRPVMVFIHGGGFIGGGAGADIYDGSIFAERGDVVLVSIQYRVGIAGWLDLEALGGDAYKHSKNHGLLDQLEALRWIHDNIANFGGDPNNVTIFGESAGSSSVLSLMVMPAAKGLFHQVIGQSCTFDYHCTAERCLETTTRFLTTAGVSSIEQVLAMNESQIRDVMTAMGEATTYWSDWLFGPVYDGDVLPKDPYAYIRAGNTADIPVIHGTTSDEYRLWLLYFGEEMRKHPRQELGMFAKDILGITESQLDRLIQMQTELHPDRSEFDQYIDIVNWMYFRYPHSRLSAIQSPHAPVWQYLFTWANPNLPDLGAYHGVEMDFVFHLSGAESFSGLEPPVQLMDRVQDAWIHFARSGDPNHENLPRWPQYDASNKPTMIFAEDAGSTDNIDEEMRLAFEALGASYGF
jgi:para-nitrobenzyl esterase